MLLLLLLLLLLIVSIVVWDLALLFYKASNIAELRMKGMPAAQPYAQPA